MHLGYLKPAVGEGTWSARRTAGTKKTYRALEQSFDRGQPMQFALGNASVTALAWTGRADADVEVHGTTDVASRPARDSIHRNPAP